MTPYKIKYYVRISHFDGWFEIKEFLPEIKYVGSQVFFSYNYIDTKYEEPKNRFIFWLSVMGVLTEKKIEVTEKRWVRSDFITMRKIYEEVIIKCSK